MYDDNNIFAKIIRSEIPCDKVYEDDDVLFFYDINPVAKVHVLGIPKIKCANFADFIEQTNETVPQWACVPEYKSALEKTLGSNALEKFKKDVEANLSLFNTSARTIYDNFKKII